MVYLDASVLVAALVEEARSGDAEDLLTRSDQAIWLSEWTLTEVVAALSAKVRDGELSEGGRVAARRQLNRLVAENFERTGVLTSDFRRANELCDQPVGLRAGDALHLAIADRIGAELATFDRRQAEAGRTLGMRCRLL